MSVNYNTLEKQNWMDNPIPNVTDEEWKEFESFFSTKSYDKEYEEFKALSNRKRKKKPSGWSTANPFTVAESDARPSDIINKEITARAVVGNPPRMFASVSQAMKNRILVVSTLFPPPFTADYYDDDDDENDDEDEDEDEDDFDDDFEDFDEDSMDFTDELVDGEDDDMVLEGNDKTGSCSGSDLSGSNREATDVYYFIENRKQRADLQSQSSRKVHMDYIDDYEDLTEIGMPYDVLINNNDGMYSSWGVDALEELAQLYNAGPVIYAEMVPDEEVYLPLHLENDFDFIPNKRRGYSQIEDFNSIATDSDKKDNDKSKNDVIDVWTSSEKKRHAKLFTVVSDWFDMLTEFKCI